MPEVIESQPKPLTRRDRFREYMKRLNPTASARDAIEAGLVVDDLHGSLYQKLAARADLEPGSQQLLVGGVGSGKTTELLLACDWLNKQGSIIPVFVDAADWPDLSQVRPGGLLAAFGVAMADDGLNRLTGKLTEAEFGELLSVRNKLIRFPFSSEIPGEADERPYHPMAPLRKHFPWACKPFEALFRVYRKVSYTPVAAIDGFDRLLSTSRFWAAVETDLAALRELNVSVLAVAPITVLFEPGRSIPDHFERVHHLPALLAGPDTGASLTEVLQRRAGSEMLGPDEADWICSASGGVLRDLISLARDAGEEAYVSGAEAVQREHVGMAIRQLGTGYLRGLGPEEIRALSALARTGSFDPHSEVNLGLLATRRVLEYSPTDFRVHPALLPLIQEAEARVA